MTRRPVMGSITEGYPLEILAIDFTTFEKSKNGLENILVITDIFTKYSVAIPTRNQKATTVARALIRNCVNIGSNMVSLLRASTHFRIRNNSDLCASHGVNKSRTRPYNPQVNGHTERFNRILHGLL